MHPNSWIPFEGTLEDFAITLKYSGRKGLWVCLGEKPFASLTNWDAKSTIGSCDGTTLPMSLHELSDRWVTRLSLKAFAQQSLVHGFSAVLVLSARASTYHRACMTLLIYRTPWNQDQVAAWGALDRFGTSADEARTPIHWVWTATTHDPFVFSIYSFV